MRGHVRKRGKRWAFVIYEGGKHRWFSGFATEREAHQELTRQLAKLDTGAFVRPTKETTGDYLARWLRDYARPNVAPTTFAGYEHVVTKHLIPALGTVPLAKLTRAAIQAYYAAKATTPRLGGGRPLSARTIHHHHVTLHGALQQAVSEGILSVNPAASARPGRWEKPEMRTFDEDGLTRFLALARETPYYPIFHLVLFTGLRRSEVLALRWGDLDLVLGQLSVRRSVHRPRGGPTLFREPKTARSRRLVALPPSAALVLREHQREQAGLRAALGAPPPGKDDLVFARLDGSPWPPDTITHAWRKLAQRNGFGGVRLHDARHTHATLLLKGGVHPKIVQERLGHATIATTLDTYSHVAPGLQEAAALRFDALLGRQPAGQPGEAAAASAAIDRQG